MTRSDFVHIASFNVTVLNDAAVPAFPLRPRGAFHMLCFFFRFFVRFEARCGLRIGSPSPKKRFVPSELMSRYFFCSYPINVCWRSDRNYSASRSKVRDVVKWRLQAVYFCNVTCLHVKLNIIHKIILPGCSFHTSLILLLDCKKQVLHSKPKSDFAADFGKLALPKRSRRSPAPPLPEC